MSTKSYSEMCTLDTFEERFLYLKLDGSVGFDTFGFDRYMNQQFYKSAEWKNLRLKVIIRDNGCDLGIPGREIHGRVYIHHINPLRPEDIEESTDKLFDMDNLVCVSLDTHNAIHFGDDSILQKDKIIIRKANDTCPWR